MTAQSGSGYPTVRRPFVESESKSESGTASGGDESEAASGEDESGIASGGDESSGIVDWGFHQGLELILHDVNRCSTCSEFAVHYCLAKTRSDPSYREAALSRTLAIGRVMQEHVDRGRSHIEAKKETITEVQRVLYGVRGEIRRAREVLECQRVGLEKVRRELENARRDRSAAKGSKSSQRPRSPSPRPHKLLRRALQ